MKIHYISPYSVEKNIGGAINTAISDTRYGPEDWFVLADHDTMILLPDTKAHVEEILRSTDYDILGCMTNRIRASEQLVGGLFSEDANVLNHIRIAEELWAQYRTQVDLAKGIMAAFMLCFRVSTWEAIGGFKENTVDFDKTFNHDAVRLKLKIGLMRGIYVFHSYRLWSATPKNEFLHLLKPRM